MTLHRWLDHLCPWVVWGAVAATGIYEPWELVAMAIPLLLAAWVEQRRLELSSHRRFLEWGVVALLLVDALLARNFLGSLVRVLFALMGLRLALPRQRRERRQLILMAFLLFLTTSVSTTDLAFLGSALAFLVATAALLLHLNWEESATLRRGPSPRAPFRQLTLWTVGVLLVSVLTFLAMPRITLGLRPFSFIRRGMIGSAAGLSDGVDLGKEGPIQANGTAVLRVAPLRPLPPQERARWTEELSLLRGLALEEVRGMTWQASARTPRTPAQSWVTEGQLEAPREAEFFILPSRTTIFTTPYGLESIRGPLAMPLRAGDGGGLRWTWLPSQGFPVRMSWSGPATAPRLLKDDLEPGSPRWRILTHVGPEHAAAVRTSQALAPGDRPPAEVVQGLVEAVRTRFKYTLSNPSGTSQNPLEDFLEHSRAGHCEYFASGLALMIRARGIPARVVNGYRLGPWVEEGGYFLVTEEQAHAWVEWWDGSARRWQVEDATPAAEQRTWEAEGLSAWERLSDTLRYRWERYVVRFSDQDQEAGVTWARARLEGWSWQLPRWPWLAGGGILAVLLGLRHLLRRTSGAKGSPGLRQLRPLVRAVPRELQPSPGETLRTWLERLGRLRPERAGSLATLADRLESHAYGDHPDRDLERQVRTEARAWRKMPRA